jgi:CBS domain-containing protein
MTEKTPVAAVVANIMSRNAVTIHVDHSVTEAAQRMAEADVGFLVVLDGDEIVGTVTDRDIVVRCVAQGPESHSHTVCSVMTRHVVYCHDHTPIADALGLMTEQCVRRLVVVGGDEELAGIFSLSDIAQAQHLVAPDRVAALLEALAVATDTPKTPAFEDPTGGRARRSPPGVPHVYSETPQIRRQVRPDTSR